MKISSIFCGLTAYTVAFFSASPIENNTGNKLIGINNSTSNSPNNSALISTWLEEGYKDVPVVYGDVSTVYPGNVSIAELPKDFFSKTSSWSDLAKRFIDFFPTSWLWNNENNIPQITTIENNKEFELEGSELPNLFGQDESSCPGVIQERCWDFPGGKKKSFEIPDFSTGGQFSCEEFKASNGTIIHPTFNVDYKPGSIKPGLTPAYGKTRGCDVKEDTPGHIVASNCDSLSLNICLSDHPGEVDFTITNPSDVEIIGVDCEASVC
ncbi:hypothetical protein [Candidatus Tisiphia endosymbiont of Hybos culiciformis]|uniref:hypothetical protein n=1 Tax=Candidatus Tisiphia endosymbiont of Hybos culiciformis TaxID=3139331 RepID=UPI003CCB30E3